MGKNHAAPALCVICTKRNRLVPLSTEATCARLTLPRSWAPIAHGGPAWRGQRAAPDHC